MPSFAEQVGAWAAETDRRLLAVWHQSVIILAQEMIRTKSDGGALPKITGNLARSILAQIGSMPRVSEGQFAGVDVGAAVAQSLLGSEIYIGFQAAYARRMNYGFVGMDSLGRNYNQQGNFFVERAVAMWPQIVTRAVDAVKNGVGV